MCAPARRSGTTVTASPPPVRGWSTTGATVVALATSSFVIVAGTTSGSLILADHTPAHEGADRRDAFVADPARFLSGAEAAAPAVETAPARPGRS